MPDITNMIAIRSSHDIPEEFVTRSGPETFSVTLRSPDGTEFVPVLRNATSHEAERVKSTLTRIIEQWLRPPADNGDSVKLSEARDALALAFQNSDDDAALDAAGHLLTALPADVAKRLDRFKREHPDLVLDPTKEDGATATCKHCGRSIAREGGAWVDPEATGDDAVWRETCDAHDTFTAEHEPANEDALRKLLADWFQGELNHISEHGHSSDWQAAIDNAKARHATFGIPWDNSLVPDYVQEMLAMEDGDD